MLYKIRIRNRILQALYRPRAGRGRLLSPKTLEALDDIDKGIEDKITPLLADFF